jgi:hypothetical protein
MMAEVFYKELKPREIDQAELHIPFRQEDTATRRKPAQKLRASMSQ